MELDLESETTPTYALKDVNTVFHLAGKVHALSEGLEGDRAYGEINVDGTRRLLEAAAEAKVRAFVFFSSVKAMGEGHPGFVDESVEPRPATAYGKSKLEAERLVLQGGYVPCPCVLRLSMVYGPSTKGNLPRMIGAIKGSHFPPLGGIRNQRSMVHVDDVLQAALLGARKLAASGQTYIVTDGNVYSTGEIYAAVRSALGLVPVRWSTPITVLRMAARLGDGLERLLSKRLPLNSDVLNKLLGSECYKSDKIVRELGFRPRHSLASSLPEIIAAMTGAR